VRAPCEDKCNDVKGTLYDELGRVFDQLPRYDMNILFSDSNAKVGKKNIFKPTIGNKISHKSRNDNKVRVVNFTTSKNLFVKSTIFPHRDIHKYI
jgi:hypothetical protein